MDIAFIYEILNKENIFIFIFGFMAGFGCASVLCNRDKKHSTYDRIGGCCWWSYKIKNKSVGVNRMYKNGKKIGIDCYHLQKRGFFKKPYCSLLDCPCKD